MLAKHYSHGNNAPSPTLTRFGLLFFAPLNEVIMFAPEFFHVLSLRRTPNQIVDIVADVISAEVPTQQEVLDQFDIEVVRQFQHKVDVEAE